MERDLKTGARVVAALDDDLRRAMYEFIREQGKPVSRDEAAEHVGISRKLAAFHLDKLVDRGLLVAHYARLGRGGRGAGRSSKLYEPSDIEVDISLPARRYDLVGEILVAAVADKSDRPTREVAKHIAWERGHAIGQDIKAELHLRPPGARRAMGVAEEVLDRYGFEPYRGEAGDIRLRNCPFHELSRRSPEIVCGMNREFIDGLLRGLGNETVDAVLDPVPGQCCVSLRAEGGKR